MAVHAVEQISFIIYKSINALVYFYIYKEIRNEINRFCYLSDN